MVINDNRANSPQPQQIDAIKPSPSSKPRTYAQEPIAVVGMGCRLPGGSNSPHALWKFLEQGGCARNEAPESRFSLKAHHDGSRKPKTMRSPGGMFLEDINPEEFDAQFFSISRTDAIAMDPQQRQLLEVVYECLENAGISLECIDGAVMGCFVGSYAVDYADMQARDPDDRAPSVTVGIGRAILSNRLSHYFNIKGPSMTIDTACSGSLVSLDVACRYLQTREVDGAIVAACNLYLSPEHNMDSGAMKGASSLTGKCHTFDVKADGYIKAEGVNAVMLKRLDDAIRDGDPIRGVIRGSATNSDGRTPGIASPSAEAQASAIRAAYANAGISDFGETSYLECHGTGTQAGDPTEVKGASAIFGEKRDKPLIIGSVKSNIGHSEPAAGISGLLKALLSIEHATIPGNPTFITPNPKIDFKGLNVQATRSTIPWPAVPFRRASVNSFGYGGSNAHVVLEEAGRWTTPNHVSSYRKIEDIDDFFADDKPSNTRPFTLVFSANDESSLRVYTKSLHTHLMNPGVKVTLPDLAYTLGKRRTHHFHRAFVLANGSPFNEAALVFGKKNPEPPRIGFVFTGQGAQWSQMGKQLVNTFPQARNLLQHLDNVLQKTPTPPAWSLLEKLTVPQNPQLLRQPEFSQPLVTALQLVILDILGSWGVIPQAVVGHSSGEIAAAYAAGYLSKESAIKTAFYRGQAAILDCEASKAGIGMLAVGLGPEDASKYFYGLRDVVQIACYNSPSGVTLSGTLSALEEIKTRLMADDHFARMLHVNLAYHSTYMAKIGEIYQDLLHRDFQSNSCHGDVQMFSSVFGRKLHGETDVYYWKANMVSPVLFDQAVREMVSGREGVNFLIEIGPSGALAGPIAQIKKKLSDGGSKIQYCTSLSRGQDAIKSLLDVSGRLFVAGGDIDLGMVNRDSPSSRPSVIIDLPNYVWNHTTKYWYESEASKDWRYRLFPHHDLLGTKILGTSYYAPVWKKALEVDELPWLKDHKMGPEIVFPAAGFIAMGVEAMSQVSQALNILEGKPMPKSPAYRVRNSTFPKALVLEEGKKKDTMLSLAARSSIKDSWHEFKVFSLTDGIWAENCRGLVRIEEDNDNTAPVGALAPFTHTTSGQLWYKAMEDAGYGFGPAFQRHLETESVSGQRTSRSIVDLAEPASTHPQSFYPMHPACIDGCLQTCAPALWNGNRNSVNAILIPSIIDDILICTNSKLPTKATSVSSSRYVGLGRSEETRNYMSNATIYDPATGGMLFQVSGLRFHKLETTENSYAAHKFSSLTWKPDVTFISQDGIAAHLQSPSNNGETWKEIHEVIDLVAHKHPNLKVAEMNMIANDTTSIWIQHVSTERSIRAACRQFNFASIDATALVSARDKYESHGVTDFSVLDITQPMTNFKSDENDFDLVIVRVQCLSNTTVQNVAKNCRSILGDGSHMLFLEYSSSDKCSSYESVTTTHVTLQTSFESSGFDNVRNIYCARSGTIHQAYLVTTGSKASTPGSAKKISLVHLTPKTEVKAYIRDGLQKLGWDVREHELAIKNLQFNNPILVLDDLSSPTLPTMKDDQWEALKTLTTLGSKILWVTAGSQREVTIPENAMIHGLARTIRSEDPCVSITTLDVERGSGEETIPTVNKILEFLQKPAPRTQIDHEFVERRGVVYISRILPDGLINKAIQKEEHGAEPVNQSLHDVYPTVRLICERLGILDSLCYTEIGSEELPLGDNRVEVEIAAAGLNFKDLAVTMGIVPENQHLLGLEGAGTIRRAGSTSYKTGQRVLVFEKGTFSNRIIATTERIYPIPDSMSFEEAATLASVYLVSIYSLYDLANAQKGHRVLIHSASGGLGIACIQLCHHIGAEVYATVGNDEKRKFLIDDFGISPSNIFSSRSTAFAAELMRATNNEGLDVIINSLTGDLLEESWRCIREGGTMVELGKKDMLDRNYLSMEPFGRNASYRCFDMAHKQVSDSLIARLLKQLFALIEKGHVRPIHPIKMFPFEDIASSFRFMRSAKHIGKIVISNGSQTKIDVPIRPTLQAFKLRGDVSYLIVGGLKGLCGSLAVQLARHGAKHLVILARSGYDDKMSQTAIYNIKAQGCRVDLMRGDVSALEDIRRVFKEATVPIGGIIQGAMVLRDNLYSSMTNKDYHDVITCKIAGTWNLHNIALESDLKLDFFSMLSSISGVVGQKGQANYAAANAFLDAFAVYRRSLGLRANSIDLGAVEEVGYISRNTDLLQIFDPSTWAPINEALFHRIVQCSITQQVAPINEASGSQLISGLAVPLGPKSSLLFDARFAGLVFGSAQNSGATDSTNGSKEMQTLTLLLKSGADISKILAATIEVVNSQFMTTLRLTEPMEPAKPLSSYGLDSLAAVELRNWMRMELKAEVTVLDITGATSLIGLCEKIVGKIVV